jgi:hypothetical protein
MPKTKMVEVLGHMFEVVEMPGSGKGKPKGAKNKKKKEEEDAMEARINGLVFTQNEREAEDHLMAAFQQGFVIGGRKVG